jgi:hypothetical protein
MGMNELLKAIDAFNRKERFFVFTQATGNADLRLSDEFRKSLSEATGTAIPQDAKCYIDYHLDWLHAAVELIRYPAAGPVRPNGVEVVATPGDEGGIRVATGNQEDIDLMVAYEEEGATWIILVEAKAETDWTNKQLKSKADRLGLIFGKGTVPAGSGIQPVFCLWSPKKSAGIDTGGWPRWMLKPRDRQALQAPDHERQGDHAWLKLAVPPGRKKVTRCDQNGTPDSSGKYWTVKETGPAAPLV